MIVELGESQPWLSDGNCIKFNLLSTLARNYNRTSQIIDRMLKTEELKKLRGYQKKVLKLKLLENLIRESGSVTSLRILDEKKPKSSQVRDL